MSGTRGLTRLLLVLVLAAAPLAGCLQGDDADGGAGDGTDGSDGTDGTDGSDGTDGGAVSNEDAYSAFASAFGNVGSNSDEMPDRASMQMTATGKNASSASALDMAVLLDAAQGVVVMTLETEGMDDGSGMGSGSMFGEGRFIAGQAWKTTFMGSDEALFAAYNESAEPPSSFEDAASGGGPMAPDESPEDFFGDLTGAVDSGDVTSARSITFNGKDAIEVTFSSTDDDGATTNGRAVVYVDPALPALIEADVKDPDGEADWDKDGTIRVEFAYDDDATHSLEATLLRLETLTFLTAEDRENAMRGFGGSSGESGPGTVKNYTVQPSHFEDHRVTLDQVSAYASWRDEEGDDSVTEVLLPLEDGSAENEDVRLTFLDEDGDGKVSTGDVLRVEHLSDDAAQYSVGFLDEESNIRLVPAGGFIAALLAALVGAVALAGGRRARRS